MLERTIDDQASCDIKVELLKKVAFRVYVVRSEYTSLKLPIEYISR